MISITAPTPSSSDHDGGNFSSHAQGFASSSLANSPETLLDSGIFPAVPFPGQVLGGGIPPPAPLGSRGCPALSRVCPTTLQLTPTSKWLQKKVTKPEAESPRRWDASGEKPWTPLPDPARHWERWEPSFGSPNPQQRWRNILGAGQEHGQGTRLPGG